MCAWWDSNPHCTDFESVVSCQLDYRRARPTSGAAVRHYLNNAALWGAGVEPAHSQVMQPVRIYPLASPVAPVGLEPTLTGT